MPEHKRTSADTRDFTSAIETFARAIAFTRCFTYPSQADRVDGLWVVRDQPRKRDIGYRREEWVAHRVVPRKVDAIATKRTRGRFCVCAMLEAAESADSLRAGYRAAGYRLHCTETFMMHRLKRIPKLPAPYSVQRVVTEALAGAVAKGAGRRQILPEHLQTDKPLRLYAALDGAELIGWLRSITVGDSTWVSNVFVQPKYRRQGVGSSLLVKMLRDDLKYGSRQSVLTATHAGAYLYERVGFELLGKLLLFTPKRASSSLSV